MAVDATRVTNYGRSTEELEEFALFCILVANKRADYAEKMTARFLAGRGTQSPFEYVRQCGDELRPRLAGAKTGQYNRIERAFRGIVQLDLRTCTLKDLLAIHGIGEKTARFFLLHTRPNLRIAVLDTHILQWLRDHDIDAPKHTPTGRQYEYYESLWLYLTDYLYPDMPKADVDLVIWMKYSGRMFHGS